MLVIRLARTGRDKYPTYRIVAAESSRPATGKFVEILGHYNPHTKELVVKHDETLKRLSQGAQPSNTVVKLLQRDKVELPAWVKLKTKAPKVDPNAVTTTTTEDTDVSEAEAAADSDTGSDAPALSDDTRVASVATDEAADGSDRAININSTETDDSEAEVQQVAEDAQDNAAKAAGIDKDAK